ncbi:MAG: MBL fold metallo-hydrolase [Armatimonadota bacterium]
MKLTIVYDNRTEDPNLLSDWGFGCVMQHAEANVLFDTGTHPKILLHNMAELGLSPTDIDAVILSHEHYDHTGGLSGFLRENSDVTVFLPSAFSQQFKQEVQSAGATLVEISEPREIVDGVSSTGPMGDAIIEQSLVMPSTEGLVVMTGCAHPGIVNIVETARKQYGEDIELVVGGFHLNDTPIGRVDDIIAQLQEMDVAHAGPCHCTGDAAIARFADTYGDNFVKIGVGWHSTFDTL